MNTLLPPLAAVDVGLIIGIVIVIVAVIGQILAKLKEVQQPPRRPAVRPPQPEAGRGAQEDEIRTFLRGAAERRAAAAPERPREPVAPRPPQPQPTQGRPAPAPAVLVKAEVVGSEVGRLRQRLQSQEPRRLVSQLGTEVAAADEKMASRVHEVFDHRLGALEKAPGDAAVVSAVTPPSSPDDQIAPFPSTAAAGLAAMFASVENVRTAVLINEILQRPEHRWT